jgi:glyoxylase-like metal-dependent hydrolase (beta-lactamase superfamily II)
MPDAEVRLRSAVTAHPNSVCEKRRPQPAPFQSISQPDFPGKSRGALMKASLGDFELMHVTDGTFLLDGGAIFGVVPKVIWQKKYPADQNNLLPFALNSLVVRSDERTILIETGAGPKLPQALVDLYHTRPCLLQNLANLGLAPDDIDVVINTHLHFDHCGWNTSYQGGRLLPTFPRATYYVQRGEVEHGRLQLLRDRVSYRPENYEPLLESGLFPGVSVRLYPGHTRDIQAIVLSSQGKTACFVSDIVPSTYHLPPTWIMAYDLDPVKSIESRRRLYGEAVPQNWLGAFGHDLRVPWAYLRQDENERYGFEPAISAPFPLDKAAPSPLVSRP